MSNRQPTGVEISYDDPQRPIEFGGQRSQQGSRAGSRRESHAGNGTMDDRRGSYTPNNNSRRGSQVRLLEFWSVSESADVPEDSGYPNM